MKTLREAFARVRNRPLILIFPAIATLLLCIIEQFNPFVEKYGSLKTLITLDYMENLAKFAQDVKASAATPGIMVTSIIVFILLISACASIFAVFFSGYAQVLYLSVLGYKPKKGDFKSGINRHFIKMSLLFIFFVLFTIIFIVLMAYTVVPAIMSIKIFFAGDSRIFFQMMLLIILTVMLLYFALVFYVMYWSFSVPGIIGFKRGGVLVALRMVNGYCWYLMPRATLFIFAIGISEVIMLALNYGRGSAGYAIFALFLNWIMKLAIIFPYINFVFSVFIEMKEDKFQSRQ